MTEQELSPGSLQEPIRVQGRHAALDAGIGIALPGRGQGLLADPPVLTPGRPNGDVVPAPRAAESVASTAAPRV